MPTLDGTPLGFGKMEVWGDSITRVLRTLGCMTQARWAWFKSLFASFENPFCKAWQPDICSSTRSRQVSEHQTVVLIELANKLSQGSSNKTVNITTEIGTNSGGGTPSEIPKLKNANGTNVRALVSSNTGFTKNPIHTRTMMPGKQP